MKCIAFFDDVIKILIHEHFKFISNDIFIKDLEVIVVGVDVEALYPSMTDVEVANLCYKSIMKSKIQFSNINYRKAINMNKTDQE